MRDREFFCAMKYCSTYFCKWFENNMKNKENKNKLKGLFNQYSRYLLLNIDYPFVNTPHSNICSARSIMY